MTVTKYYQAANGKVAKVVQSGNNLTPEEEGKLRTALGDYSLLDKAPTKKETGEKKIFTPTGKFRGADYKTGLQSKSIRRSLANLETNEEKRNYLNERVGKDGWVVDKQGTFLLTPAGRKNIGERHEGNNLLAIDAEGSFFNPSTWEGEDWSELAGEIGLPMLAGIGSEIGLLGLAAKYPKAPILSVVAKNPYGVAALGIGSVVWGLSSGVAEIIDETQQKIRGLSKQGFTDEVIPTATSFGIGNMVGGLAIKGLGKALTTGFKELTPAGRQEVKEAKEFIRKANKKNYAMNPLGPEGINRSFVGGAINIGSKVLGREQRVLKQNIDAGYDDIMETTLGLKKGTPEYKKFKEEFTVDDFANYADDIYDKQGSFYKNIVKPEANKDINNAFKYVLNDVRNGFTKGRNFDDVAKNYDAAKGLFYNYLETGATAINADFKKLAKDAVKNLKTTNQVEVFGPKQLKEALQKIKDNKRATPKQKEEQRATITALYQDAASKLGKNTDAMFDDTYITVLKPSESTLRSTASKQRKPKQEFLQTILGDKDFMKDRIVFRMGKDVNGEMNFKTVPTPTVKKVLEEFGVKAEDLGMGTAKSNNPYIQLMKSDNYNIPAFTPTEMNQILTGINNYQIQSINGKLGVKDAADKLREAAFQDLDNAITKLADDSKQFKSIMAVAPQNAQNKKMQEVAEQLNDNFAHMMDMRQKFREFKGMTDVGETMQMMNKIAKGEQSPIGIFKKINDNPEFTLDIANAFKALPKPEEMFKKGFIPKEYLNKQGKYNADALSKRQRDVLEKLKGTAYEPAMKKRIAYELSLTDLWPSMMSGATNEKQALDMLGEQWFKHLGLTPEGFNINIFKQNLNKSLIEKPVSTKSLTGKDYTAKELADLGTPGETFMSPAEALFRRNPAGLKQLKDLNENLLKYPDELLNENATLLNAFDDVVEAGGNKQFSEAIVKFNKELNVNQQIVESQAKKIIDDAVRGKAGFTPDFSAKYFKALKKEDIDLIKNKFPDEFENLKSSGIVSLMKATGSPDGDWIMKPDLVNSQLKSIGKDKFNRLYSTPENPNPYGAVTESMEILTKVNQLDGTGNLVAAGMRKGFMDNVMGLAIFAGSLGLAGGLGGKEGFLGTLGFYSLLIALATNKKFAKALSAEIKPLTNKKTFMQNLKDRNTFEKRFASIKNVFVANQQILNNSMEEASASYDRAKSIYGPDLGFGTESGIPSLRAAQERLQEVKLATKDDRLFPAFRAARSRGEQIGLPNVAPIQTGNNTDIFTRQALSGNNPATQQIAQRTRR